MATPSTDALVAGTAQAAGQQLDALCRVVLDEIVLQLPELAADGSLAEALGAAVRENLAAALAVLADPEGPLPPARASLDHARRLAQRGLALSSLLRAYRLGQAAFQSYMIEQIAAASDEARVVARAAQSLSSTSFSYVDRMSGEVVQAYQTERDYWQRQRIAARAAQIDALLTGSAPEVAAAERALGHVLEQEHLAVVLWVEQQDGSADQLAALEQAAAALAGAAQCAAAPLVVARDVSTVWAWLPSPVRTPETALAAGVLAACGHVRRGLAGFRASHREALDAQRVAAAADPSRRRDLTTAADAGPLGLLCQDVESLARWVRATLGPLALDDAPTEALRRTVEMFLATGGSYVHTGRRLVLHRNSVQYRVSKARDLLGYDLEGRRVDVELALRACRLLGSPVLQPVG